MHGNLRNGENQPRDVVANCGAFRARAFDEFQARGHVVKQVSHIDACAPRSGGALVFDKFPAFITNLRAELILFGLGLERNARNRRDGSQRFPAKAERANRKQVVCGRNLAGRVAKECRFAVLVRDSAAIVGDADAVQASVFNLDGNRRCARVDCVFHEFFDNRTRPLDDFARGYLVRNSWR